MPVASACDLGVHERPRDGRDLFVRASFEHRTHVEAAADLQQVELVSALLWRLEAQLDRLGRVVQVIGAPGQRLRAERKQNEALPMSCVSAAMPNLQPMSAHLLAGVVDGRGRAPHKGLGHKRLGEAKDRRERAGIASLRD